MRVFVPCCHPVIPQNRKAFLSASSPAYIYFTLLSWLLLLCLYLISSDASILGVAWRLSSGSLPLLYLHHFLGRGKSPDVGIVHHSCHHALGPLLGSSGD